MLSLYETPLSPCRFFFRSRSHFSRKDEELLEGIQHKFSTMIINTENKSYKEWWDV